MEKHVNLLGIFWIVYGAFHLIAGFVLFGILYGITFIPDLGHDATIILRTVGLGLGLLFWILSVPKIIAGIGLLKKREWGRIFVLVLAFLALLEIPLGTALGVYSLVILLKQETIQLFKK